MLGWLARNGRLVLVAGLVIGIAVPALARAMQPLIVPLIAMMLFLATLRIGTVAARPRPRDVPLHLGTAVLFQTVMPLAALAVLTLFGWQDSIVGLGVVLALAASPITGSPGLAILSGADPMPALRAVVVGTALLPLTVLPVFWFMPIFPDPAATLIAAGRLLAIIVIACGGALVVRRALPGLREPRAQAGIDGLMALSMGVVVIGLMSAVGPALMAGDPALWWILGLVLVLNFSTQLVVWAAFRGAGAGMAAPSMAIVAGNRNLALFLAAVPPEMAQDLLLFLGCFQIPMYLTPLTLARLYARAGP
jgi:hypothetical protein